MSNLRVKHKTEILRDFPCGPVVKTVLPLQEACTPSLDTELRSGMHHGAAKKSTEGSKAVLGPESRGWGEGSNRPMVTSLRIFICSLAHW